VFELLVAILKGLWDILTMTWWVSIPYIALRVAVYVYRRVERRRLASSGIQDIDHMDGRTFEKRLEVHFSQLGYRVELTPYVGDYGADLVITKAGVRTVVQAKRHKRRVGLRAVQEAVAAKGKYNCAEAMVVTNRFYTHQARELARANRVTLWDRKKLIDSLSAAAAIDKAPARATQEVPAVCARCGAPVGPKVRDLCLANPDQYGGKVYCYAHREKR
jgi:restriction system protein